MISIPWKFLKWVFWPRIGSILVNVLCKLKENVNPAAMGWRRLKMPIICRLMALLSPTLSLLVLCPLVCPPPTMSVDSLFLVAVLAVRVAWCPVVRCVHTKDCYVCLENCLLYHYGMPSLSLMLPWLWSLLHLKLIQLLLLSFKVELAWYIFPHPFTFNFYVCLYLKCIVFCRQHILGSCFLIHSQSLSFNQCI